MPQATPYSEGDYLDRLKAGWNMDGAAAVAILDTADGYVGGDADLLLVDWRSKDAGTHAGTLVRRFGIDWVPATSDELPPTLEQLRDFKTERGKKFSDFVLARNVLFVPTGSEIALLERRIELPREGRTIASLFRIIPQKVLDSITAAEA